MNYGKSHFMQTKVSMEKDNWMKNLTNKIVKIEEKLFDEKQKIEKEKKRCSSTPNVPTL